MSYEQDLKNISFDADGSIGFYTGAPGVPGSAVPNNGMQYRFVKIVGKNTVGLAVLATNVICGILQNKPQQAGAPATVGYQGVSNLMMGATCNAGDLIAPGTDGRGVVDATNGRWQALEPCAGAGTVIPVFKVR